MDSVLQNQTASPKIFVKTFAGNVDLVDLGNPKVAGTARGAEALTLYPVSLERR